MDIDAAINAFFKPASEWALNTVLYSVEIGGLDVRLLVVWLAAAAVFFTIYLGFINFRYFGHAVKVVAGRYDNPDDEGQISSFQALMASMSGTVGLGNIAGVAVAVSVGGPGAAFWLVVMGLLAMSSKFAEVTLGVHYRNHDEDKTNPGRMFGGPMYYLEAGLKKIGVPFAGKALAILFAVCCIAGAIGGACMFQANQVYQQLFNITGGEAGFVAGKGWMVGAVLAVLVGAVIIGGIRSIAAVASAIVPLMAVLYVTAGIIVIAVHYQNIPESVALIFSAALTPEAGFGGLMGALLVGVQRAAFSNEAGLGTAAILYAAAKTDHPVRQGMASMLGPFIDTVVVCTITALMIVVSGVHETGGGIEGVELTSRAMESGVSWFPYVLAFAVFLFAYSSMITFAYYGAKCTAFIFGYHKALDLGFKMFFCFCAVIGASMTLGSLIDLTDAMILSMAIPNIIGLYVLAPEVKHLLKDYLQTLKEENS